MQILNTTFTELKEASIFNPHIGLRNLIGNCNFQTNQPENPHNRHDNNEQPSSKYIRKHKKN